MEEKLAVIVNLKFYLIGILNNASMNMLSTSHPYPECFSSISKLFTYYYKQNCTSCFPSVEI